MPESHVIKFLWCFAAGSTMSALLECKDEQRARILWKKRLYQQRNIEEQFFVCSHYMPFRYHDRTLRLLNNTRPARITAMPHYWSFPDASSLDLL